MLRWILGSAAVSIAVLLAFVVLELNPAQPVPEGYFYTGAYEKPGDLNPFTTTSQVARRKVLAFTHDALMDWDPETGKLRAALATVESAGDGVTFVFTLREGLRFSDGSPVRMEDVLFTWEVCSDPTVPLGTMGGDLSGVREAKAMPGMPERLQVILSEPYFGGLETFAAAWTVVQKHYFQGEIDRLAGRPVQPGESGYGEWLAAVQLPGPGTGAYQLEERVSSRVDTWQGLRELRLVQSSDSWRRRDCAECWRLDGFRLRFIADADATFNELLGGNLGWYYDANPTQLLADHPELAELYKVYDYDYRNLGHYWIVWNVRKKPFDNVEVRRALSMLFDRHFIVSALLGGKAKIATAFFKPGTASYPRDVRWSFNIQAARGKLQEAGIGPEGETLAVEILAPVEDPIFRRVLDKAVPAFREAGIELVPRILTYAALEPAVREREFDGVFLLQGHGAWVDPYSSFHSTQAVSGRNFMGYENTEVDRILEDVRVEFADDKRVGLYARFNTIIQDEQPVTFLAHPRASMLIDRRIQGVKPGPLGLFEERWWVER